MIWLIFLSACVAALAERPSLDADGVRQASLHADGDPHSWFGASSFLDLWGASSSKARHHRRQSFKHEQVMMAAGTDPKEKRPLRTGEMKTKEEFHKIFKNDHWKSMWEDAAFLKERRRGPDNHLYTWEAWQDSFKDLGAWDTAPPGPPARIEVDDEAEGSTAAGLQANSAAVQAADEEAARRDAAAGGASKKTTPADGTAEGYTKGSQTKGSQDAPCQKGTASSGKSKATIATIGSVPANQAPPDDSEEDPYAELRQDAPVGMDEPIPGSNRWEDCLQRNAHPCSENHCCCDVGSSLKGHTCVRSAKGDKDPSVVAKQIKGSTDRSSFGPCDSRRFTHKCGNGCCCSGYLEWNVQNEKCEEPPSSKGPDPGEQSLADSAPPREEDAIIPGSQTWKKTKSLNTCELREAYSCGKDRKHCCCRFGCVFIETIDKCSKCRNDAPVVLQNMIPASQLWEKRVKQGICNAKRSHPCGPGCCCNAGWSWSKELRVCQSEKEKNGSASQQDPGEDGDATNQSDRESDEGGGSSEKGSAKSSGGAIALLLFLWAVQGAA
mmetsp:Transcript_21035/g.49358  ORF Transcript_21035/g.49358 Transcript_21035/m.49358 type:complete len:552 (+) Transcript_21035:1-1656(+)